ncbi:zinc finger, CCHC-type containing protein [Tanacetum coccineum]
MTTSVGNNSVFRSFFEKQKLTGPNFIDWYRQLRLVLSTEDKEYYLEHPIPAAPVAQPGEQIPPEDLAAHAAWVKGQREVAVLMLLTMDLDIQRNLAHLGAYDMLQELKAMFSKQAEQELLQTVREFHTCKQEEGQSVSSHVLKMKGYIDNLERLGQPVGQNLAVSLILVSLNKDFASFVQNFNMHGMGKTVNELHAMLKLHEESLPKKDANPALHAIRAGRVQKNQKNKPHKAGRGGKGKGKNKMGYAHNNVPFAPKPKTSPPPKKDNPAKDAICHQCGEVGHWRRNCPVYLTELMKKKKLPQGASASGIFTIELYSFPSKSWIYDTGCGTHICITTQGLRGSRKLKPGALSLYVGDGHRAAVEAIGTYHLELPSGLVIVLNNCHYAPSITREEYTNPSVNTSLNHEEDEQEIEEPQSEINPHTLEHKAYKARAATMTMIYANGMSKPPSSMDIIPEEAIRSNLRVFFTQNPDEPCVYLKASGSYVAILILYVDDILLMGNNIPMLHDVKSYIGRNFAMKDLGEAAYILGIKIYRDRSKRLIGLNQSAYIEKILEKIYMKIPNVRRSQCKKSLNELVTRQEIVFVQNGVLFDWKSTKQSIFATSSMDAEYIAAFDASKEAVWIRKFISGLGIVPTIEEPISMYEINTVAIAIAKMMDSTKGARQVFAQNSLIIARPLRCVM